MAASYRTASAGGMARAGPSSRERVNVVGDAEGGRRLPPGVSFDRKRGVYRARVAVEGVRTYLGAFETAEQAAEAYGRIKGLRQRRGEVRQARGPSQAEVIQSIREQAAENWRGSFGGRPEPTRFEAHGEAFGDLFAVERPWSPVPQVYEFVGKGWARRGGKTWALWRWRTCCGAEGCGEAFEAETPGDLRRMTVPSAFCKAHRKPGRTPLEGRKAFQVLPQPEGGARGSGGQISGPSGDARGGGPGGLREQADLLGVGDLV